MIWLALLPASAHAATTDWKTVCLLVQCDHPTVQLALDAGETHIELIAALGNPFSYDGSVHASEVTIRTDANQTFHPLGDSTVTATNGGHLILQDMDIGTGMAAPAIQVDGSALTLERVTVGAEFNDQQVLLEAIGDSDVTVTDSALTWGWSPIGGCIRAEGGSLTLQGATLLSLCTATDDGGSVYANDVDVTITGPVLLDQGWALDGAGGNLALEGGTLTVACDLSGGCPSFLAGLAFGIGARSGGGQIALEGVTATVDGAWLDQGFSMGPGGGIVAEGASLTLTDVLFTKNVSNGNGGSVHSTNAQDLVAVDSVFEGGGTAEDGGAISVSNATFVSLQDNTFRTSVSFGNDPIDAQSGGAVYADQVGDFSMSGGSVVGTRSFTNGARRGGGGVHLVSPGGPHTLSDLVFDDTTSLSLGGAVLVDGSGGPVLLERLEFHDVEAPKGGAVATLGVTDLDLRTSWVCGADADEGGALYLKDSCAGRCAIENTVFVATTTALAGGAIGTEGAPSGAWLFVDHVTGRGLAGPDGALISTELRTDVSNTHATFAGGPALDLPTGSSATGINLFGQDGSPPTSPRTPNAQDLTLDPPLWLPAAPTLLEPATTLGPCDVEVRIHPFQGATGGRGLGAFEGTFLDPDWELNADGDADAWRHDCDEADAARGASLPEVCDDGLDNDCDGMVDGEDIMLWYPDNDGDGFGAQGTDPVAACDAVGADNALDCDDSDADVFPGAPETCNGADDDCNGMVDDGPVTEGDWFAPDLDGDGFADVDSRVQACVAPPDHLAVDDAAADCDDTDAARHPLAVEIPDDGLDQNCDGFDGASWVQGAGCTCATGDPGRLAAGAGLLVLGLVRRRRAPPR